MVDLEQIVSESRMMNHAMKLPKKQGRMFGMQLGQNVSVITLRRIQMMISDLSEVRQDLCPTLPFELGLSHLTNVHLKLPTPSSFSFGGLE